LRQFLYQYPAIVGSCLVGNNLLGTSFQFICAIIEPAGDTSISSTVLLSEIMRAIASANRNLAPSLRISRATVLVFKGQHIPIIITITKKGAIFRKKLEEVFGYRLASLISGSERESEVDVKPTKDQVCQRYFNIVAESETLKISAEVLEKLLPSQRLVPSFCAFYYNLLICYASSEWIRLWLR
jgi:hypothetical protein